MVLPPCACGGVGGAGGGGPYHWGGWTAQGLIHIYIYIYIHLRTSTPLFAASSNFCKRTVGHCQRPNNSQQRPSAKKTRDIPQRSYPCPLGGGWEPKSCGVSSMHVYTYGYANRTYTCARAHLFLLLLAISVRGQLGIANVQTTRSKDPQPRRQGTSHKGLIPVPFHASLSWQSRWGAARRPRKAVV